MFARIKSIPDVVDGSQWPDGVGNIVRSMGKRNKHEVSTCRVQKRRSVTGWYLDELSWIPSICELALISSFKPLVALASRLSNILPARDSFGVSSRAARPLLTTPKVSWLSLLLRASSRFLEFKASGECEDPSSRRVGSDFSEGSVS